MSSIDKFRSNPTQNLGEGYYPFGNNYNNFKAFQQPPSQPVENDFVETKGVGNPLWILHEPLPTPYTSVEEIRPQGSIIVFPSYVYHQGTPITRGTRYSMVLWSLGQPFV